MTTLTKKKNNEYILNLINILKVCCKNKNLTMIKQIFNDHSKKFCENGMLDWHSSSLLKISFRRGDLEIIKYLLKKFPTLKGYKFFSEACKANLETVKYLLETSPEHQNQMMNTLLPNFMPAISQAMVYNKLDIVEYLFEIFPLFRAEIIKLPHFHNTPLSVDFGYVKTLIEKYPPKINPSIPKDEILHKHDFSDRYFFLRDNVVTYYNSLHL